MSRRILAVDDNEIVGWTLAARLWIGGYDVDTVKSAQEAICALKERPYDLVLMDLDMPGMSGLEAVEHIVRQDLCSGAPILVLTSSDDFAHVQRAYALGAKGYMTKTSSAPILLKAVSRLINAQNVIWIDDHHCVLDVQSADQAQTANLASQSIVDFSDQRPFPPKLRLVSACADQADHRVGIC